MIGSELDLLPDDINWRDKGCEFFPSCLNCPLPKCVEDGSAEEADDGAKAAGEKRQGDSRAFRSQ